jgi:hypothetical protein
MTLSRSSVLKQTATVSASLGTFALVTVASLSQVTAPAISASKPSLPQEILQAHNKYRTAVKVPALTWSPKLAQDAQKWANHLASLGGRRLVHSPNNQRPNQGENLWLGTSGYFSYTRMVDGWGAEKKYFRNGTFPNVSSTGNWADVGHYTQIVWRKTTQVGCAVSKAGGNDILVCRYSPPGNYMGQKVY